jgi:hypothetical protein
MMGKWADRLVMGKWADRLVSQVQYDSAETHIVKVMSHPDKGASVGRGAEVKRQAVLTDLDKGVTYMTITRSKDGDWNKGADIKPVTIDGVKYIKSVADATRTTPTPIRVARRRLGLASELADTIYAGGYSKKDNLGDLPRFTGGSAARVAETKADRWSSKHWRGRASATIEGSLWVGIVFLIGVVVAIFGHSIYHVIDRRDHAFSELSQFVISNVLLVFIVLELIEIALHQIRHSHRRGQQAEGVFSPYLSKIFLRMLLIVGILSTVRHLLVLGAQLTTSTATPDTNTLWELGVTAAAVLALIGGLIVLHRWYDNPNEDEAEPLKGRARRE